MLNKPLIISLIVGVIVLVLVATNFKQKPVQITNVEVPKTSMPDFEKAKPVNTKSGNTLDLSGAGLEKLPNEIWSRADLISLDVSDNNLSGALPSQIGQLKKLKSLDASNNQMTGVPAEIGRLTDLESIDFANNKLTGLPNELGNLSNLKIINLTGNDYSKQDMAEITKKLPNLKVID